MYSCVYTISDMITIRKPIKFEWDEGNQEKNNKKHNVSAREAEEVFSDINKRIAKDFLHSKEEDRFLIIGRTTVGRKLFIVFTIRQQRVRIISARDLNKKEYKLLK